MVHPPKRLPKETPEAREAGLPALLRHFFKTVFPNQEPWIPKTWVFRHIILPKPGRKDILGPSPEKTSQRNPRGPRSGPAGVTPPLFQNSLSEPRTLDSQNLGIPPYNSPKTWKKGYSRSIPGKPPGPAVRTCQRCSTVLSNRGSPPPTKTFPMVVNNWK